MTRKEISIIGAGTYCEVMFELAETLGYVVNEIYDENEEKINQEIMGVRVVGKFSGLDKGQIENKKFIVAIGNNNVRNNLMEKITELGGETPTLIHPSAIISPSAKVGKGVYIHANTYIWTKVIIEDYCIISPNVVIAHHSVLGQACLVSTLSAVGASLKLGDRCFVGMGSTIVTGVKKIGSDTIIGAGAVVLKDVESNSVYAGLPAKKLRDNNLP